MLEYYKDWFKFADDDLVAAKVLLGNKKYRQGVFQLQQSCEKISKGLLMRMGFLRISEEDEKVKEIRKSIGLPSSTPKGYTHAWHLRMLEVLDGFTDEFDAIANVLLEIKLSERKTVQAISDFKGNVPDYKERIKVAKRLKANPNPSLQEFDAMLEDCNRLLDGSAKAEQQVLRAARKIRLPKKKLLLRKLEKRLGVKIDEDEMKKIDKLYRNPVVYAENIMVFSITLIVLAVLNTYLLPHEQLSRYPDTQIDFVYDESLAIIMRSNEVANLLRRCSGVASKT